ncbi:MAG: single-stranded-DNA-specific exonuclease RecJ, partial [Bryobacteraceae bacterium]
RLNEYAAAHLTAEDLVPTLAIDCPVELPELTVEAVDQVLALQPFGCGNPAPVFAASGVRIAGNPIAIKEKHLRFSVHQNGRSIPLKAWNFADRAQEITAGRTADIAFSIEEDSYSAARGYQRWAAALRDIRP